MQKFTINAEGKKLGRIASAVASILMGKKTPTSVKNQVPEVFVTVENLSKLDITNKKLSSIKHVSYSGYPGGLKIAPGSYVQSKFGSKAILLHAISKMIPRNKLHKERMKKIEIKD